jgi:hypothetical protein
MIQIYPFSSGVTGSGIRAYVELDKVYSSTLNRPLHRLYENDVSIIKSIDASIVTNNLNVSSISARTGNNILIKNNVEIEGNLKVTGSIVSLYATDLYVKDNIVTINYSQVLAPSGEAGLQIDRGTGTPATMFFKESSLYWEFSHSGIRGKNLLFDKIKVNQIEVSIIDLASIVTPSPPDSGRIYFYVSSDRKPSIRYNDGLIQTLITKDTGSYNDYIYNQESFENYFANSYLYSGEGYTFNNFHYSVIGTGSESAVVVDTKSHFKLLMFPGSYRLTTRIKNSNNFILHGTSRENCRIVIGYHNAGFISSSVTGIEYDNFTVDASDINYTSPSLFNLSSNINSNYKNKVKNFHGTSVYMANNNTKNLKFSDCEKCGSVVFKKISYAKVDGDFKSNINLFGTCVGLSVTSFVDDSQIFGCGDFDS